MEEGALHRNKAIWLHPLWLSRELRRGLQVLPVPGMWGSRSTMYSSPLPACRWRDGCRDCGEAVGGSSSVFQCCFCWSIELVTGPWSEEHVACCSLWEWLSTAVLHTSTTHGYCSDNLVYAISEWYGKLVMKSWSTTFLKEKQFYCCHFGMVTMHLLVWLQVDSVAASLSYTACN